MATPWNIVDAIGPVADPSGPHGLVPLIEFAGGAAIGGMVAKKHPVLWAVLTGIGVRLLAYTVSEAGAAVPGVTAPLSGYPTRYRIR